jgi:hypothetical protein
MSFINTGQHILYLQALVRFDIKIELQLLKQSMPKTFWQTSLKGILEEFFMHVFKTGAN